MGYLAMAISNFPVSQKAQTRGRADKPNSRNYLTAECNVYH